MISFPILSIINCGWIKCNECTTIIWFYTEKQLWSWCSLVNKVNNTANFYWNKTNYISCNHIMHHFLGYQTKYFLVLFAWSDPCSVTFHLDLWHSSGVISGIVSRLQGKTGADVLMSSSTWPPQDTTDKQGATICPHIFPAMNTHGEEQKRPCSGAGRGGVGRTVKVCLFESIRQENNSRQKQPSGQPSNYHRNNTNNSIQQYKWLWT